MENNFGKTSKLNLLATVKDGRTILENVYFTAPFKIMKPFYEHEDEMSVMCQTASAGIMEGDVQEIEISLKNGAKVEFISQAFEKIHKMVEGEACRNTKINIGSKSYLSYNPLPTIPFKDSAFTSTLEVDLKDETSCFIMKEILSCGRAAREEYFAYRYFHNLITVKKGEKLIYRDNTRYEPGIMKMNSVGMYEGFTHFGTILMIHVDKEQEWLNSVRSLLETTSNIEGAITRLDNRGYVIRALGQGAECLMKLFQSIEKIS